MGRAAEEIPALASLEWHQPLFPHAMRHRLSNYRGPWRGRQCAVRSLRAPVLVTCILKNNFCLCYKDVPSTHHRLVRAPGGGGGGEGAYDSVSEPTENALSPVRRSYLISSVGSSISSRWTIMRPLPMSMESTTRNLVPGNRSTSASLSSPWKME